MATKRTARVYLIGCEGCVKIGVSTYGESRIEALQTGNPFELYLIAEAEFTDAFAVEKHLHATYSKYRIRGEWFKIPPPVMQELMPLFSGPDDTPQDKPKPANDELQTVPDNSTEDPEYWSRL